MNGTSVRLTENEKNNFQNELFLNFYWSDERLSTIDESFNMTEFQVSISAIGGARCYYDFDRSIRDERLG